MPENSIFFNKTALNRSHRLNGQIADFLKFGTQFIGFNFSILHTLFVGNVLNSNETSIIYHDGLHQSATFSGDLHIPN